MKTELIQLENGRFITIMQEEPLATIDPEMDKIFQKELESAKKNSSIYHEITYSIITNNYEKFTENFNLYHNNLKPDNVKDINTENKKINIGFFIQFLANKPEEKNIDIAISFLEKGEYIKKEFIALCLWSLYQEKKTKDYLCSNNINIPDQYYDALFDRFQPHKQLMSQLPLGISEEEQFLNNRKRQFFDLTKQILYENLDSKIPTKNVKSDSKIKI